MDTVTPTPATRRPLSAFLQTLMGPALEPLPDGELLARFAQERDEAAFAHLVRRHGPMVLAVARRVLRQGADAEDVGQAVFLLLAQRAHRFGRAAQLGGFLHAVATRTAWKARARRLRRAAHEAKAARAEAVEPGLPDDLPALIDRALQTLPAKYRDAVILCDLEGVPRQLAAERLGVPLGTLSSRLATAHQQLARRLTWPLPAVAAALTAGGAAEGLASATLFTLAVSPTRLATGAVATLVMEVSRAMLWTKIKAAVAVGFLAAAATGGGVAVSRYAAAEDGAKVGPKEGGGTPATGARPAEGAGKAEPAAAPKPSRVVVPPTPEQARALEEEMAKFNGNWVMESSSVDGERQNVVMLVGSMTVFDGRGGVQEVSGLSTLGGQTGKYRVNHLASPKQIMIVYDPKPGVEWPLYNAIYEFDGDKLRLATLADVVGRGGVVELPRGFTVAEQALNNRGLRVVTYRRLKPGEGAKPPAENPAPGKLTPAAVSPAEMPKSQPAAAPKADSETAKFQGTWDLWAVTRDGKPALRDGEINVYFKFEAASVEVSASQFRPGQAISVLHGRYTVDAKREPRLLAFDFGAADTPTTRAHYQFDGHFLKVAFFEGRAKGDDHPRGFQAAGQPEGSPPLVVMTFVKRLPGMTPPPAKRDADPRAAEKLAELMLRSSAAAAPPAKLKQLQRERVAVLKESLDAAERLHKAGSVSDEELAAAKRKFHRAELDACDTDAERAKVLQKLLLLAVVDQERAARLNAAGSISAGEARAVKLARIEAEIELQKALGP